MKFLIETTEKELIIKINSKQEQNYLEYHFLLSEYTTENFQNIVYDTIKKMIEKQK